VDKSSKNKGLFGIGVIIIVVSIILYLKGSSYWFYPAPIGFWLFFDILSNWRGNKTTIDLLYKKDYWKFIKFYIGLFIFGMVIEAVGSILFNLWSYKLTNYLPTISTVIESTISKPLRILGWFIYPFMLMQFKGLYQIVKSSFKSGVISTLLSMLIGITIWEVPNVYSQDWIYQIPFSNFEIFKINLVVVVGWVILIWAPIILYDLLNPKS